MLGELRDNAAVMLSHTGEQFSHVQRILLRLWSISMHEVWKIFQEEGLMGAVKNNYTNPGSSSILSAPEREAVVRPSAMELSADDF
ncbi:hypothetical protein O9G_001924 [Rozella allomycis CSF55]|uniref:Uncharacterized protein n=1 Tax=Rozella allomycis (strain CSF55) TaxID=988480 RepID=A0A075AWL9_ROZAC|nr:hypothetical protein O9G_001924 [Rozella allomycis CSF55]|eukprot:EPZ34622.1 hypothetical protein O9G_001924 [Rozella allomycis CSF55]